MVRLLAFDLDGTLTQHRTKLEAQNREMLQNLAKRYRLLMVGAGTCRRIFEQMDGFPIEIIGSYGMQYAKYDEETRDLRILRTETAPVDENSVRRRAEQIRIRFSLYPFAGDGMQIHPTGALTFPVLGTEAAIADKLAYDPDRAKRRVMYPYVKELFPEYTVMIGGSSSFDMAPQGFGKLGAIRRFLSENGISKDEMYYIGDDCEPGGNDYDVLTGGIPFIRTDDYTHTIDRLKEKDLL